MRLAMLLILGSLLLTAGWLAWSSPQGFATQNRDRIAWPSSRAFPAGTDELGRDRAVRMAFALLLSLGGASLASVLAGSLSVGLGLLAGMGPAWLRACLLYAGDLFLTLPSLFLLMLVRSALPLNLAPLPSGVLTFLLLALLGAPAFLRMNEKKTSFMLKADWVLQAHAAGLRRAQLGRQVLPHLRHLFWTQFLLFVPACLIAEANLGTLGFGLTEPLPSLGTFLASLQSDALLGSSWLTYLPVAVIIMVLICLELLVFGEQR